MFCIPSHSYIYTYISTQICRSVCDGGQIVWANSIVPEGLVENSRVPLATSVGMPICSVGGSLCIFILFATQPMRMTPNAVEFLCSIARVASGVDSSSGFAPFPFPSYALSSPKSAKTDQFRGRCRLIFIIRLHIFLFHKALIYSSLSV